jgi:hypothetical protein
MSSNERHLNDMSCARRHSAFLVWTAAVVFAGGVALGATPALGSAAKSPPATSVQSFDTPDQAAAAIVAAARTFDVSALHKLLGAGADAIIFITHDDQDRERAADFAAQAAEKTRVVVDSKSGQKATLMVGNEDWPFPVPLVKRGGKWHFDAKAGQRELMFRRIGANELDAIEVCRGYVEAQFEYSLQPRPPYQAKQYAQKIISTPGTHDGLAWQNADGTWGGPVGENVALAIQQGYKPHAEPYHGYYFKILKGQGPAARLGQLNYVIEGAMIGGFALVAAPAEYGVTGFKTFMVSYDGVVYEKDFGAKTSEQFQKMELFNPDKTWTVVPEY